MPTLFLPCRFFAARVLTSFYRRQCRRLAAIFCLAGQAWLVAPAAFSQGSLTPPGAPAPTMKTLTQIEPRTVIDTYASGFTTPYLINQPGSYYLGGNLAVTNGGNAIVIAADNVTLDLNGFFLTSSASTAAGAAVANYNGNAYANGVTNIPAAGKFLGTP